MDVTIMSLRDGTGIVTVYDNGEVTKWYVKELDTDDKNGIKLVLQQEEIKEVNPDIRVDYLDDNKTILLYIKEKRMDCSIKKIEKDDAVGEMVIILKAENEAL